MKLSRMFVLVVAGVVCGSGIAKAQVLDATPEVLIIPKGNTFGLQVTCTGCDLPGALENIEAEVDDTNYATVDPDVHAVSADPEVTIFNVKGENQGGTILRISLTGSEGEVLAQVNVTIQVTEDIDDDCIFDDLTVASPGRTEMLGVMRDYRDQVLSATQAGRRYAELYYRHSQEVLQILDADARLRFEVHDLAKVHTGDLQTILSGGMISLSRKQVARIDDVLATIESQAQPALRRAAAELRTDLKLGKKLLSVGVSTRHKR